MILKRDDILQTLKLEQSFFESDGVKILGIFGSYARNEATEESDVDILIETTSSFLDKYRGFRAFSRLDDLKEILQKKLHKNVDFADKSSLGKLGKEYILKGSVYV